MGRVGSLALALGIGAAVAGGTGLAHADGSTDNAASGSAAESSPSPSTGQGTTDAPSGASPGTESVSAGPAIPESASAGSTDVKTGPPESSSAPKMQLGNGRPAPKRNPQKLATALAPHAPDTPRIRSHASAAANDVANEDPPTSRLAEPAAEPAAEAPSMPTVNSVAPVAITPNRASPVPANPIAMVVTNVLSALGITPTAGSTGGSPVAPMPTPIVQAMLQLVHREVERLTLSLSHIWPTTTPTSIPTNAVPSIAPGVPAPTDEAPTVYGDIGKWMLQPNGQISNYGGIPYDGRTVLEPVNVIIVDPTSTSAAESACKLNTAMFWSGFPAQPIHSTGFQGTIDDVTYGQQPTGLLLGFSDNFFLFPNNHGRIFGPDPVETSTGYVWSGAFSTEQFVIYNLLPGHAYVSSNMARNALAMRLIASGQATYGGMVPLNNSYNTATTTTGDHDGYAVVLILR